MQQTKQIAVVLINTGAFLYLNLLCALPSESETSVSELVLFQEG